MRHAGATAQIAAVLLLPLPLPLLLLSKWGKRGVQVRSIIGAPAVAWDGLQTRQLQQV
jgi:hypothetical protein